MQPKKQTLALKLLRPPLSVGIKTWVAFTFFFFVPLTFLFSLMAEDTARLHREASEEVTRSVFKTLREIYDTRFKEMEAFLHAAASVPAIQSAFLDRDADSLSQVLLGYSQQRPEIGLWLALDTRQRALAYPGGTWGDVVEINGLIARSLTTGRTLSYTELVPRDLVEKGIRGAPPSTPSGRYLFQIAVAPVEYRGRIVGALLAGMMLNGYPTISDRMEESYGVEAAVFVGDAPGGASVISTSTRPRSFWSVGSAMPEGAAEAIDLGRPYYGQAQMKDRAISVAFEPLKSSRGAVLGAIGIAVPGAEKTTRDLLLKDFAIASGIGFVLALVLTFIIYWDITRPINILSRAMDEFGKGNFDVKLILKTNDEFEKLGEGFNRMGEGIRVREERLRRYNEIARFLITTLELREFLENTLKNVVEITGSHMGIIYLAEENGGDKILNPYVHYGLRGEEIRPLRIGDGYPGRAALERTRLHLKTVSDRIEVGYTSIVPKEVVYIPLVAKERLLGVLTLGSLDEYNQEAIDLFDYLASQIAIILDNAITHREVKELSRLDPLTQLFNRRFFFERLGEEFDRARRHRQPLSVLIIDIDDFKRINDTLGHVQGDTILKEVARILGAVKRRTDLAARYGGEEFVLLLPHTDREGALETAEKLRGSIEGYTFPGLPGGRLTLSAGAASYSGDGDPGASDPGALIAQADGALYRAKGGGKNRVVFAG